MYEIQLSPEQNKVLIRLAEEKGKTPQEIIDDTVAFNLKSMLETEAMQIAQIENKDISALKDTQKAELFAVILNAKQDYLVSLE